MATQATLVTLAVLATTLVGTTTAETFSTQSNPGMPRFVRRSPVQNSQLKKPVQNFQLKKITTKNINNNLTQFLEEEEEEDHAQSLVVPFSTTKSTPFKSILPRSSLTPVNIPIITRALDEEGEGEQQWRADITAGVRPSFIHYSPPSYSLYDEENDDVFQDLFENEENDENFNIFEDEEEQEQIALSTSQGFSQHSQPRSSLYVDDFQKWSSRNGAGGGGFSGGRMVAFESGNPGSSGIIILPPTVSKSRKSTKVSGDLADANVDFKKELMLYEDEEEYEQFQEMQEMIAHHHKMAQFRNQMLQKRNATAFEKTLVKEEEIDIEQGFFANLGSKISKSINSVKSFQSRIFGATPSGVFEEEQEDEEEQGLGWKKVQQDGVSKPFKSVKKVMDKKF